MRRRTVVSSICASLLLGAAMTAVAQNQEEHRNEKQEARPENRQEQARPQEQNRPEERQNQEPRSGDRRPQNQESDRQMQDRQQQQRQQEDRQQQGRQQPQQPRQGGNEPGREVNGGRQDQARGGERRGENQRRIPEPEFHAHFGREHRFAPGRMQVFNGQSQFYYGGYTFALVEAWPEDWAYDADDYYIDEFDGEYWLFNLENPGVRLELIIIG